MVPAMRGSKSPGRSRRGSLSQIRDTAPRLVISTNLARVRVYALRRNVP